MASTAPCQVAAVLIVVHQKPIHKKTAFRSIASTVSKTVSTISFSEIYVYIMNDCIKNMLHKLHMISSTLYNI